MFDSSDLQSETRYPKSSTSAHWVALFAAAFTWPLLFVGGLVTTYRVGMAVPDWPTTFGMNMFLYNFWNASWGVFVEHGHRLYGSAVGLACIVLAVWFTVTEWKRRPGLVALGWLALLAVIGQGVLGGARVLQNSTYMAAIHGCTGQAFFALMVVLCVLTGKRWMSATSPRPDPSRFRQGSLAVLALIYGQIIAGAWLRHYGAGLAVHASLAVLVGVFAVGMCWWVEQRKVEIPELVGSARALGLIVVLQIALGIASWWVLRPFDGYPKAVTSLQAIIRTGHQANGALLLASAVVLSLRAYRHLTPSRQSSPASLSNSSRQNLEAVT